MNEAIKQETITPEDLHLLSAAHFQPYTGKDINICFDGKEWVTAQLEMVTELKNHSELERAPFSILLQTDLKTTYYPQAIYTLEHPAIGPLHVFLVPVGVKEKGVQYEAVFS